MRKSATTYSATVPDATDDRFGRHLLGCLCTAAWLTDAAARAADVKADAPPGQVVLRHTPGGEYFVASDLKEEYDRLLARVQSLQADLDAEHASGPDVLVELKELRPKLDRLRTEIEQKKVLVSPLKVHSQTEETTFDLGPERLLVITADHVRVLGWEGPRSSAWSTRRCWPGRPAGRRAPARAEGRAPPRAGRGGGR